MERIIAVNQMVVCFALIGAMSLPFDLFWVPEPRRTCQEQMNMVPNAFEEK